MSKRQPTLRCLPLHRVRLLQVMAALLALPCLFSTPISAQIRIASDQTTGAIVGEVADSGGALIPGAQVVLGGAGPVAGTAYTAISDAAGRFRFAGLPAGAYHVHVEATGFESFTSPPFPLTSGETHVPLAITLAVPSNHADVTVTLSHRELAGDELHAAEQQRVLGLFPNFYTSFIPNPQPLDIRQKFSLAARATTDSMAFVTAGVVATGEQLQNTFPGYGSGRTGFAKRYGAAYADGFIGKFIGAAVLPSVFRQDPRYFYRGTGTLGQRARHAMLSAVLARHDTGRWEPNYSHILGNAAAGAISATYHPASNSAGSLARNNALIGVAGGAAVNLAREFLFRPFTRGISPTATGQ